MTNNEILKVAREYGLHCLRPDDFTPFITRNVKDFARRIAAMQREIDAELVEDFVSEHSHYRAGQRIREQSDEYV